MRTKGLMVSLMFVGLYWSGCSLPFTVAETGVKAAGAAVDVTVGTVKGVGKVAGKALSPGADDDGQTDRIMESE